MKKRLLLASLLAVAALASCGGKESSSTPVSSTPATSEVATSETPATSEAPATSETTTSETPSSVATSAAAEGTVAHALAAANALADNAYSETKYTVSGYVVSEPYFNSKYSSYSFNLADTANGTEKLYVYSAKLGAGLNAPVVGSKVTVSGYLQKYVKEGSATKLEITFNNSAATDKDATITACDAAGGTTGGDTTSSSTTSATTPSITLGQNQIGLVCSAPDSGVKITGADVLGMDSSLVTVTQVPGATDTYSNDAVVSKVKNGTDAEIRIYTGAKTPGSLTFTMANGKLIESIEVVCETSGKTCNDKVALGVIVKTGDTVLTATNNVYTVNAASVTLTADGASGQAHITKLVITYKNA